jgi:hypothetical protein
MQISTIFAYLGGSRRAILELASESKALSVGALFVLSAALARNYDRASLLHEPWRLLGPFVASLAVSGALFVTIYGLARSKGMEGPGIARGYATFLTLYWMTAPLGWLYGIPYERFLSPLAATEANLWTLGLVSLWRVALMIRVVSVVFGISVPAAMPLVMLVADVAALAAVYLVPLPVISLMGGISPEQSALALTALLVRVVCWLSLPVWIVLAAAVVFSSRVHPEWSVVSTTGPSNRALGTLTIAGLTIVAWAAALPFTQPEQILAHRVDKIYRSGGRSAALALLSAHERREFPPDWQPPPRRFPGEPTTIEVLDMLEAVTERPYPDWLVDLYTRRFLERLSYDQYEWPEELLTEHVVRLAALLTRLPRGPEIARELDKPFPRVESILDSDWPLPGHEAYLSADERAALETILRLAGKRRAAEDM